MDILKSLLGNLDIWQIIASLLAVVTGIVGFKWSKLKGLIKVLDDALDDNKISSKEFEKIYTKLKALISKKK